MTRPSRRLASILSLDTEAINTAISNAILRVLPRRIVETLATVFGIWTAIVPLLLWVAWSAEVLGYVLVSGAVSLLLCGMFSAATAPKRSALNAPQRHPTPFQTTPKISRKKSWRDSA